VSNAPKAEGRAGAVRANGRGQVGQATSWIVAEQPTRQRMRVVMKEFGNLQVVNRRSKERLGTATS